MATKTAYPFRVEPQEVDFSLRITLVALGGNILNIAGIDAHTKGFGVDALNKDNFSWVLSRIAFEFDYRPEEYVKYEIATWISDYGRVLSTRNFTLTDTASGREFGRAVTQWAMIDLQSRSAIDLSWVGDAHADAVVDAASPTDKPRKIREVLGIPENLEPLLVLALGFQKEVRRVETVGADGSVKYWRDAQGVHHVPKRPLEDLLIIKK